MDHRSELALADVLEHQSALNTALAKQVQAAALTADKYDAAIDHLRRAVGDLQTRVIGLEQLIRACREDLLAIELVLHTRTEHLV